MSKYIVTQRPHYINGTMVHPNRGEASVVEIDDTNEDPSKRVTPGRLLVPYSKAAVNKPTAAPPVRTTAKIAGPVPGPKPAAAKPQE
jgi:hypothetical protein